MKKRDLDKFRKLLQKEKDEILRHLLELEGASQIELTQEGGDPADLATVEINQASIQKLGNREKKLISKIDHALNKIDSGEYGTCERCGEDISVARLEARPVAQYCIDCKTELEQNERRYTDVEEGDEELWGESDKADTSSS